MFATTRASSNIASGDRPFLIIILLRITYSKKENALQNKAPIFSKNKTSNTIWKTIPQKMALTIFELSQRETK